MRIFIALDLPEEIRVHLREYIERMRPLAPDAPWVRAESLHVTLKFIGEAKDPRVEEVKGVLRQIKSAPFEVEFKDVGFFPSHNSGRVFWDLMDAALDADHAERGVIHGVDHGRGDCGFE